MRCNYMSNYMAITCQKVRNTNYHELSINSMRSNYMSNYMAITCQKVRNTNYHELVIN